VWRCLNRSKQASPATQRTYTGPVEGRLGSAVGPNAAGHDCGRQPSTVRSSRS